MFPNEPIQTQKSGSTKQKKPKQKNGSGSSSSSVNETDTWTDEEWSTAYAEAEVRVSRPSAVAVVTSMSKMGLVEITFEGEVFIPWYMLFNETNDPAISADNSTST